LADDSGGKVTFGQISDKCTKRVLHTHTNYFTETLDPKIIILSPCPSPCNGFNDQDARIDVFMVNSTHSNTMAFNRVVAASEG